MPNNRMVINLRLHAQQVEALDRMADERNVSRSRIIREGIEAMTGVSDPLLRFKRPGRYSEVAQADDGSDPEDV